MALTDIKVNTAKPKEKPYKHHFYLSTPAIPKLIL